jgi:two-component system NtrC family sensor kinase
VQNGSAGDQQPVFISDVFKGMRGAPHFIVSVRQERNGMPWILRATIDFGEFNNLVEFLRIGKQESPSF